MFTNQDIDDEIVYDVDYFINKFSKIKSKDIGDGEIEQHCALWHCGIIDTPTYAKPTTEALALSKLIRENIVVNGSPTRPLSYVWAVNDDVNNSFVKGRTPKARIMNTLLKIKEIKDNHQV